MDEKVICYDRGNGGSSDWALMANQWQNNPFAYMMILGMMRFMYGDNWQNQYGNNARMGELASNLNVDVRAIQSGICDVRSGIQQIGGDVRENKNPHILRRM